MIKYAVHYGNETIYGVEGQTEFTLSTGDKVTVSPNYNAKIRHVNKNEVANSFTWTVAHEGNYKKGENKVGTLKINPAELTITMKDRVLMYNNSTQYGWNRQDTGHELVEGLAIGESLMIAYTPSSGKEVGSYLNGSYDIDTLCIKDGDEDVTNDYKLVSAEAGRLTISEPDPITITADKYIIDMSKTYRDIKVDSSTGEGKKLVVTGSTTEHNLTIKANEGEEVYVVFQNLSIDVSQVTPVMAAVAVKVEGKVTIELKGVNTVKSAEIHAGIQKDGNGTLIITAAEEKNILNATGGRYGAGIGGGKDCNGSNITVSGGTVNASGGENGAGIGGGSGGFGSCIIVDGGVVNARGGIYAAGIGGGNLKDGFNITIKSGIVSANGGEGAAGIGGGVIGLGYNISITGNALVKSAGGISDNKYCGASFGDGTGNSAFGSESIITTITDETSGLSGHVWRYPAGTTLQDMTDHPELGTEVTVAQITFDANKGSGVMDNVNISSGDTLPENSFIREGFEFTNWNSKEDGSGTSYKDEEVVSFIGEITLYAQWAKLYNVTINNGTATNKNGKTIKQAIKGTTVTVTAATPDEGKAFIEWSCDDITVTFAKTDSFETTFVMPEGEVNVEAVIKQILVVDLKDSYEYHEGGITPEFKVEFEGTDIALLDGTDYEVTFTNNDKPGTASVTVTISGPRAGSKTVTFKITGNTVRWLDGDGSVLEEAYYTTDMPSYSKGITPTRKDVPGHKYTFKGWVSGTVEKTEYGDVTTYIPEFYDEVIEYNVTFVDADGTILQSGKVAYGDLPAYSKTPAGATGASCPAKFTGWEPAITNVTGDATYTATYGEHVYNQEVVDAKYLKSAADCITAAVYYKSCACGEKSTDEKDIFTSGEPAGHKWKAATGYAPKTCEVCGLEEGQKVTYDPIKDQVFVWTKGSKEPFVLTIKRSQDDVNCFLHYLNTLLDGAEIKVEARSGSTIITIPAETLEKLSVGEHKITVVFDDWKADFALSIAEAPADTTPVTGDTMPVVPVVLLFFITFFAAAGIVWYRKKACSSEI